MLAPECDCGWFDVLDLGCDCGSEQDLWDGEWS